MKELETYFLRISSCLATILVKNLCCELKRFHLLTIWWFYLALLRFKLSGLVFTIYHYSSWEALHSNFIISWNNWSQLPSQRFLLVMTTNTQFGIWQSRHMSKNPKSRDSYLSCILFTIHNWQHLFSQTHPVHNHVHFHYHLTHHHHHHHQHYLFLS